MEERTAEILRRSAELDASNKELQSFSYSVSHDLRGPLRRMNGFGKMLLEEYGDRLDESGRHYIERICVNAERMAELIDDLLTLSHITRSELSHERVDLSAIAQMTAETLSRSEPQRRAYFEIQEGIVVEGDYPLLSAVLSNLLSNAWKFSSREEETHIEFGTMKNANCDPPNQSLDANADICFVRDNGVGFDMEYADKLFGAFQRLHRVDEFEGTGIGLATVQRIIHRHGGRFGLGATRTAGQRFILVSRSDNVCQSRYATHERTNPGNSPFSRTTYRPTQRGPNYYTQEDLQRMPPRSDTTVARASDVSTRNGVTERRTAEDSGRTDPVP